MRIAIAALLCTTALAASAADKRVVRWTHAEASKRIYKGSCPVRLIFTGTISAARPGEFTYAWKRSDGAVSATRTVQASKAGESWRVREMWELSGTTRGWAQLWIASEQRGSRPAHFRVQCK
jgi:hypothetical protein